MSEPKDLEGRRAEGTAMDGWGVLEQAGDLTRRGEAFALATVVWRQGPSSGQQGSRAIITGSGELRGWIGGACAEPAVIREAQRVIARGVPQLLLLGPPEHFAGRGQPAGGEQPAGGGKPAAPSGAAVPEGITFVPIACQSEGALEVYIEPVLPAPHLVIVGRSPMARGRSAGAPSSSTARTSPRPAPTSARWSSSRPRGTATRKRSRRRSP